MSGTRGAGAGRGVCAGLKVLELGSGAAGPVATKYLAEHGADVIRIESSKRPDFLRVLFLTPDSKHGVDGSPMFILLNPNKRSVALNMKHPEGVALAKRLALEWADVVSENFAPGPMERFGMDYATLAREKPDLVMVSGCLFGQTGPHRGYPGFGAQGSALSGFNHLTGWPDRASAGPSGTITDSLAPRYVALAMVAALLERRRTGEGQYVDVSQIEAAVYSTSEVQVRYSARGEVVSRNGNRSERVAPHGAYPCSGKDRWLAIAIWNDDDWQRLRERMGHPEWSADPAYDTNAGRLAAADALDEAISQWTREHDARELMTRLQAVGIEASVCQEFREIVDDPQLAHRGHWARVEHSNVGSLLLERSGFRLSQTDGELRTPGPNLGEHTDAILSECLGLDDSELERLRADEVLV
ncbi:MAG: CoA transferase [Deltaproteobacteria bacterium]|nr:CoA transferase [Deltaproteobacteria bacterium]